MGQNAQNVMNVSAAFAEVSGRAAAQANINRANIANANISAGEVQLDLALRQERGRLAQAFSKHQGTLAVNAAFRGSSISDASPSAALTTATLRAANEAGVAKANRAAQQAALEARNQFVEEDVGIASIEGAVRGLGIGMDILNSLSQMTEVRRLTHVETFGDAQNFGFANVIRDVAFTPGLDLSGLQDFGFNVEF